MEEYGVKPDVITFSTIMNGWSAAGYMIKCREIFDDMVKAGIEPDVHVYSILAKGYVRTHEPDKAEELLNVMVESGIQPNVVIFTTVISGWCSAGSMSSAMRVFRTMLKCGVSPNLRTFETLISGYAEAKMPQKAEAIIKCMEEFDVLPQKPTFMLIAEAWRAIGQSKEAMRIMRSAEMQSAVYQPNQTAAENLEKIYQSDKFSFCYPKLLQIPSEVINDHSRSTTTKRNKVVLKEGEFSSGSLSTATKSMSLACRFGPRSPIVGQSQYQGQLCISGQIPYPCTTVFFN